MKVPSVVPRKAKRKKPPELHLWLFQPFQDHKASLNHFHYNGGLRFLWKVAVPFITASVYSLRRFFVFLLPLIRWSFQIYEFLENYSPCIKVEQLQIWSIDYICLLAETESCLLTHTGAKCFTLISWRAQQRGKEGSANGALVNSLDSPFFSFRCCAQVFTLLIIENVRQVEKWDLSRLMAKSL